MGNSSTDTCCLTLPLKLEKWQEDRLAKRFELARQIYNTLVHAELKKLERVKHSAPYREIQRQIQALDRNNPNDKAKLQRLDQARDALLERSGFRERTFKSDIKYYYKHFSDNIGSYVAFHGIAPQVWAAFYKVLFKGGKKVHYKQYGDVSSVQGYSRAGKSGGTEIMFRGTYIEWKGLKLPLKLSPDNAYENEMLRYRVKYVRLVRKPGKQKDRWYAQLALEGKPVVKREPVTGEAIHPIAVSSDWTLARRRLPIRLPEKPVLWSWRIKCRILSRQSAAYRGSWIGAGGQQIRTTIRRMGRSGEASS